MADSSFKISLQAVLDNPVELSGFGLERSATEGRVFPIGVHEFEERLSLNRKGQIAYFLRRPAGDQGGIEVGLYNGLATPEEVTALVQLAIDSDLDALQSAHPEPGAMCWGLASVATGQENRFFTGIGDPAVLIPIKTLRQALDKLETKALANPVWSLSLNAKAKPSPTAGWTELTLVFANSGTEGIWIDHPTLLDGKSPGLSCQLVYGDKPQIQQGITPLPMTVKKTTMRYPPDSPAMLWIGPGAKVEVVAAVESPTGGPFLGRIAYVTYPGTDRTAGHIRFAGGVFTKDFEF